MGHIANPKKTVYPVAEPVETPFNPFAVPASPRPAQEPQPIENPIPWAEPAKQPVKVGESQVTS